MGVSQQIPPGGHFPLLAEGAEMNTDELDQVSPWSRTHPSFELLHGEPRPPGLALVEKNIDAGLGRIFRDKAEAEAWLGQRSHPAPLGNVSKPREDGTVKHRVIQDLRANSVNSTAQIPERQVLPRGLDHAVDMAELAHEAAAEDIEVLVLDFANAFMTVPLAGNERPVNCSVLPQGARRTRPSHWIRLNQWRALSSCGLCWGLAEKQTPSFLVAWRAQS